MLPLSKWENQDKSHSSGRELLLAQRTHSRRACAIKERRFERRSQDSGNLIVDSVCRDSADGLCEFGVRSGPRVAQAERRRAACLAFDMGKPIRLISGSRKPCGKVG